MLWSALAQLFSTLLELIRISRSFDHDKDLEILILRNQLGIAQRKLNRTIKPDRIEKLTLAVLTARLKRRTSRTTNQLRHTLRIVSPRTVIRWHNQLVKRNWIYSSKNRGGRPRIDDQLESLILRLARENIRWVYGKFAGELNKLGILLSKATSRNVLRRHGIVPAPVRAGSIGWRQLMKYYIARSWPATS